MLDNVEVVIEDEPSAAQLAGSEGNDAETLFGLYEGTPRSERGTYTLALPDKVTIFRGPLERSFPVRADLAEQVRLTVVHELAHHLGMDERRIEDLGWG
jgi:predicted Zn-dependent protease with MMP-like domain